VEDFRTGERVTGECGIGCGHCSLCQQGLNNICPDRVETGVFNRDGAYAKYICVPYQRAHHLYDLTFQEGALIESATVGLWIARRANIGPGDRVGVFGTGTVGLMATQMASLAGADLVVAAGRKIFKLNLARDLGAHKVIDLREQSLEDAIDQATNGKGFNVVIEAAGVPEVLTMALRAAAPRARVIVTGVFEGELQTIDLNTIMPKELAVIGSLGGPTVFDEAIGLVHQTRIKVLPLNTHTFPLPMGAEALAMVAKGQPDLVKIHLDCMVC
jgi:threonine dehydrogenase-like Zn-dependent dehydrogenase